MSKSLYVFLLRLYPRDFAVAFAAEMLRCFQKAYRESHRRGPRYLTRFVLQETSGLLVGAALEWFAKLTTNERVRGRCLPDLRFMRPAGVDWNAWFRNTKGDQRRG